MVRTIEITQTENISFYHTASCIMTLNIYVYDHEEEERSTIEWLNELTKWSSIIIVRSSSSEMITPTLEFPTAFGKCTQVDHYNC